VLLVVLVVLWVLVLFGLGVFVRIFGWQVYVGGEDIWMAVLG
jgi:hypothetical protein